MTRLIQFTKLKKEQQELKFYHQFTLTLAQILLKGWELQGTNTRASSYYNTDKQQRVITSFTSHHITPLNKMEPAVVTYVSHNRKLKTIERCRELFLM